jgi:hypothetical protein
MFKKKNWNKPFSEKIAKRVKIIPRDQLSVWIETSSYEVTRCIREYEKTNDLFFLKEALTGAEALHASVNELYDRSVI